MKSKSAYPPLFSMLLSLAVLLPAAAGSAWAESDVPSVSMKVVQLQSEGLAMTLQLSVECPSGGPPKSATCAFAGKSWKWSSDQQPLTSSALTFTTAVFQSSDLANACSVASPYKDPTITSDPIKVTGVCNDGTVFEKTYQIFALVRCSGGTPQEIHSPVVDETGPPEIYLELGAMNLWPSASRLSGNLGGIAALGLKVSSTSAFELGIGVADLDPSSAGVGDLDRNFDASAGAAALNSGFQSELRLVTFDLSYVHRLAGRNHFSLYGYAGPGYSLASQEARSGPGGILFDNPLAPLSRDSFTLHLGLGGRWYLNPRTYLNLQVRERWYDARPADRSDTEVRCTVGYHFDR